MLLAKKNIHREVCIETMYNITTFIYKCIHYPTAKINNAKPQLLLHQPNNFNLKT